MPVEHKGVTTVVLKHPKGASVEVLLYGATVISWICEGQELFFVSSKARLDGSKPVRGGIPIVFPCFGAPTHPDHSKLTQHGFARSEMWNLDKILLDNDAGVSVRFCLEPNDSIKALYSRPFKLSYVVTLAEHQLSTNLHVENTSQDSEVLEFQALLHNYILAPADDVTITPLKGLTYYDKTESTDEARAAPKLESREEVTVSKHTDSVYEDGPLRYRLSWPHRFLNIKAKDFKDVVVWNPQEGGQGIGDMEPGGWKKYVCVEPGYVRGFVRLEAGKCWIGQQVLSVVS